jgi:glycogen debranching enzyme
VTERDAAYHQGTVWPWLMGPFIEAWLRVHGNSQEQREHALEQFVKPLERHFESAGLGHLPELVDGDAPYAPGGCPFQAWSLGEYLRVTRELRGTVSERSNGGGLRVVEK